MFELIKKEIPRERGMKVLTPEGKANIKRFQDKAYILWFNLKQWCSNHVTLTVFTLVCWIMTPLMFIAADIERGYDATGGEVFTPFLPLIAWAIGKTVEDDRK